MSKLPIIMMFVVALACFALQWNAAIVSLLIILVMQNDERAK